MRKLPLAAHEYGAWSTSIPASCTKGGTETRVCALCSAIEDRGTELAPHTFGKAKTITSATCTKTGLAEHSCVSCGYTEKITTDKAAHSWIPATCLKPMTCKECAATLGDKRAIEIVDHRGGNEFFKINEETLVVTDDGDDTFTLSMEFWDLGSLRTHLYTMQYYDSNGNQLTSTVIGSFIHLPDGDDNYCALTQSKIPADTVRITFTKIAF